MADDLKKLYDQVDELRAEAVSLSRPQQQVAAYSLVLGLINAAMEEERSAANAIDDLVDRFSVALKAKLHAAEEKYGYTDGWMDADWRDALCRDLRQHVQKGDPRDVAAYCAFAWHHGWSVSEVPATRHYSDAEIAERLATADSHPHGDARDVQMLRQLWEEKMGGGK